MRILATLGLLLSHALCTRGEAQEIVIINVIASTLASRISRDVNGYINQNRPINKIYQENLTEVEKDELYLKILSGLRGTCDAISSKLKDMLQLMSNDQQDPSSMDKDIKALVIDILKAGVSLAEILESGSSKPFFNDFSSKHAGLFKSKAKVLRAVIRKLKKCQYPEFAEESVNAFKNYIEENEWYYRGIDNWEVSMKRAFKSAIKEFPKQNPQRFDGCLSNIRAYPFIFTCFFILDSLIDLYF